LSRMEYRKKIIVHNFIQFIFELLKYVEIKIIIKM